MCQQGNNLYHSSLFAGHQGVIKMYLTIGDKFFIPGLIHYLRSYIKVCHICQLFRLPQPSELLLQLSATLHLQYGKMTAYYYFCLLHLQIHFSRYYSKETF